MKQYRWLILLLLFFQACAPSGELERTEVSNLLPIVNQRTSLEIFESCQICHSTKEMQRGPIIDGLPAWYVTRQLEKFKNGGRGASDENRSAFLMASTKDTISVDELERVATFIAGLPPPEHLKVIRGNTERGKVVYQSCIPCHGERGEGNIELKGPPLNILEDWYLLDQLRKFKTSLRGNDPRDIEGMIMQQAMTVIDEDDFRDLVRYIAVDLAASGSPSDTENPTE